jgi:hypothetical protein
MQFNMLTQKCFNACANDFSRRSLTEKEVRSCLGGGLGLGLSPHSTPVHERPICHTISSS